MPRIRGGGRGGGAGRWCQLQLPRRETHRVHRRQKKLDRATLALAPRSPEFPYLFNPFDVRHLDIINLQLQQGDELRKFWEAYAQKINEFRAAMIEYHRRRTEFLKTLPDRLHTQCNGTFKANCEPLIKIDVARTAGVFQTDCLIVEKLFDVAPSDEPFISLEYTEIGRIRVHQKLGDDAVKFEGGMFCIDGCKFGLSFFNAIDYTPNDGMTKIWDGYRIKLNTCEFEEYSVQVEIMNEVACPENIKVVISCNKDGFDKTFSFACSKQTALDRHNVYPVSHPDGQYLYIDIPSNQT